jgi:hypothetical protein
MQILDVALPPEFKVRPVRKLIVAITCFVALILAIAWSLFREALVMVKADPRLSQQYDLLVESWLGRGRFGLRKPGVVSSTTP